MKIYNAIQRTLRLEKCYKVFKQSVTKIFIIYNLI